MTPLLLFLLGLCPCYLGTVTTAFNALMRLSLRLMAERSDRDDAARPVSRRPAAAVHPGAPAAGDHLPSSPAALLARVTGVDRPRPAAADCRRWLFVLICEHLDPAGDRPPRSRARARVLLPSFDVIARLLRPLTYALLRVGAAAERRRRRRRRRTAPTPADGADEAGATPRRRRRRRELQEGQARELLRSLVDFRETMVREVMTPRPDIVAIEAQRDASASCAARSASSSTRACRSTTRRSTTSSASSSIKDLILLDPARPVAADHAADPAGALRARNQARAGAAEGVPAQADAERDGRRRVRRHRRPGDGRRPARGDRRRDPRRVRRRSRAHRRRGPTAGSSFSGSAHVRELERADRRSRSRAGLRDRRRLPAVARSAACRRVGEHFEVDGLDVEVLEAEQRRITRVRVRQLEPSRPRPQSQAA